MLKVDEQERIGWNQLFEYFGIQANGPVESQINAGLAKQNNSKNQ